MTMAEKLMQQDNQKQGDTAPTMADSLLNKSRGTMADRLLQKGGGGSMADRLLHGNTAPKRDDHRLTAGEVAEAKANQHHGNDDWRRVLGGHNIDAAAAFTKGFTHNFDEYAASLNKGLGKVADAILPEKYNTGFFKDNAKYWDTKRKQNEIETEGHDVAKLAGEIVLDPLNVTPAGVFSKGSKVARITKSAAAGIPIGYGTSAVKNYGNTEISDNQKSEQNMDSAALVGILNGVIAGLTKGKVQNAFKDIDEIKKSVVDGNGEAAAAIKVLKENPEAVGLSRAKANEAVRLIDMHWSKDAQKEASRMYSVLHNDKSGTIVRSDGGNIEITPEFANKMKNKHLDDPELRGMVTTEETVSFPKVVRNIEPESLRQGETWIAKADDGNDIVYGAGEWDGSKKLKTVHSKTEKGERGQPHREFNDRDFHDSDLPTESITQTGSRSQINFDDPLVKHVIERGRNRAATQTRYDKIREVDRNIRHVHNGKEWENQIDRAVYSKNPEFDFALTKADVKAIDKGKITPEIEEKIRQDVSTMENHPDWMDEAATIRGKKPDDNYGDVRLDENGNLLDADGNELFSNAGHNLAVGFGAGTVNAADGIISGDYDPNRDISEQMAERFIRGMAAGVLGVQGLRLLRKHNPEAFKKVQQYFVEHDVKPGDDLSKHGGVKLGVFAGEKAKKFDTAPNKHTGKYDGFTRFEIDDSKMVPNEAVIKDLMSGGDAKKLGDVIEHKELFDNYPDLKNIDVKFDKNMRGNASFDGDHTITISDKFNDIDDVGSSILHEIQHAIQSKEGFAGGGSFADKLREVEGKIYDLEKRGELSQLDAMNYANELNHLKTNKTDEAFDRYRKIAGEIEAREVQARQHLTPEERELIPAYENSSTLSDADPEAYNAAFMAELDGRHKDFDSTGIAPEDASLDFSRSRADNFKTPLSKKGKLAHLEKLTNKEINKQWKDVSATLTGHARLLFRDTFSGDYHKARDITHAAKNRAAHQAEMLHRTLMKLPENQRKDLHEYIVGDIDAGSVDPNIKEIGDNIKHTVSDIQQQLIENGFSEEMINAWGDNYLKRIYEQHFGKKVAGLMPRKMTVPKTYERGKTEILTSEEVDGMIERGELDLDMLSKPIKDGGVKLTDLGDGRFSLHRDWTKAEREAMGEITDAAVTIPETIVHMNMLLEHSKFLKSVSKIDGAVLDPKTAKGLDDNELLAAGYARVPNNKKYGALAGQAVRRDVFGDINALNDNVFDTYFGSDNRVGMAWKKYLQLWKKSKTVWNAPTHLNNLTSNFFLMHLAGLNPLEISKNVAAAGKMMHKAKRLTELEQKKILNMLTDADKTELQSLTGELKYYKEAHDLGLLRTSFVEDIGHSPSEVAEAKTKLAKLDDKLTQLYQDEDGINKLAMYKFLRESGWTMEKSRQAVEMIMPDYSRPMAQGWRFLRDTGVTPFIAWTYYTFPKMFNLIKTFRGGVQAATALGALYGLQYVMTGAGNPFDDTIPDDFQGSRIGVSRDGENVTTVKMDRVIPYLQPMNPKRFARDFIGSSPMTTALSGIMGNKIYNGRPITSEHKPIAQQTYDYVKYLTQGLTPIPGQVSNAWNFAEALGRDRANRKISSDIVPRTATQEALKLIGINTITYNRRKAKQKKKKHDLLDKLIKMRH